MHWTGYEVFSVLSGAMMIVVALVLPGRAGARVSSFVAGVGFIAYGIYVGHQTSGIYFFPVQVFVIPVVVLCYLIAAAARRGRTTRGGTPVAGRAAMSSEPRRRVAVPAGAPSVTSPATARRTTSIPPDVARGAGPEPTVVYCTTCATDLVPDSAFCTACGSRQGT
jgi:hypothetical protein